MSYRRTSPGFTLPQAATLVNETASQLSHCLALAAWPHKIHQSAFPLGFLRFLLWEAPPVTDRLRKEKDNIARLTFALKTAMLSVSQPKITEEGQILSVQFTKTRKPKFNLIQARLFWAVALGSALFSSPAATSFSDANWTTVGSGMNGQV